MVPSQWNTKVSRAEGYLVYVIRDRKRVGRTGMNILVVSQNDRIIIKNDSSQKSVDYLFTDFIPAQLYFIIQHVSVKVNQIILKNHQSTLIVHIY